VSAKGTRRCLADTGSASTMSKTRTKRVFGSLDLATGEAECAATQTEHWASSPKLECWCTATLYADNSVSSRHSQAAGLRTDRMNLSRTDQ
jgi:hypothetical protein